MTTKRGNPRSTLALLEATRSLLEPRGSWGQGIMEHYPNSKNTQRCLLGALRAAAGFSSVDSSIERQRLPKYQVNQYDSALKLLIDTSGCAEAKADPRWPGVVRSRREDLLMSWNDRGGRSRKQVLHVLDQAIDIAKGRQRAK